MKFQTQQKYITLIFLLYILIGFIYFFDVVYEESATASRAFGFKGIFMYPVTDFPVTQIFISNIFAFLYSVSQQIPWYGIIDYSMVIISLLLFFRFFRLSNQFYLLIPFLVLILDDIILFSFTRTAMLASAAGLFGIFNEINNENKSKKYIFYIRIILLSLLCLYGFFNRPQAFAYVTALFFLFIIIAFFLSPQKLIFFWRQKLLLLIPFGLVTIFLIIHQSSTPPSVKQAQKLTPAFYNIHSSNYHESFENLSRKDSLALVLIKNSYVNDLEIMNPVLVDRITKSQPKKYISLEKFTNWNTIKQTFEKFAPFYKNYHLFEIVLIMIVLCHIIVTREYTTRQKMGILVYVICAVSSLFIITNIVKMEMRISSPTFLIIFLSLLMLMHLSNETFKPIPKWYTFGVIMISIYFGIQTSHKLTEFSKRISYRISKNIEFKNMLDSKYKGKTMIISNTSFNIVHRSPFQEFENKKTFDLYFFEGEAMVYQPTCRKSFIEYCGSLKVEDIFDTMFARKEETFYLAVPNWKRLMLDYLEAHYNKRYVMEEFDTLKFNDNRFEDIILYKPKEVISTEPH